MTWIGNSLTTVEMIKNRQTNCCLAVFLWEFIYADISLVMMQKGVAFQ